MEEGKRLAEGKTVAQTARLVIREFTPGDLDALHRIMAREEVMYAWEHGFTLEETGEWIESQRKRYESDGCGYDAVIRVSDGRLIGQAGLLVSKIWGERVTELGYVFDNAVWGNGYATEAGRALAALAFGSFGLDTLYCTIRPENTASVRVARRLGFCLKGEHTINYRGKEMPHLVFTLEGDERGIDDGANEKDAERL